MTGAATTENDLSTQTQESEHEIKQTQLHITKPHLASGQAARSPIFQSTRSSAAVRHFARDKRMSCTNQYLPCCEDTHILYDGSDDMVARRSIRRSKHAFVPCELISAGNT
jgi:hypothetical protein